MTQPTSTATAADAARAYLAAPAEPAMFSRELVEQLLAEHDAATVHAAAAEIEAAHANERGRLNQAMANAWIDHCDTLKLLEHDPGWTGCTAGCDSPHHEHYRQALAEIARLTAQLEAVRSSRNGAEAMYGVFKNLAARRKVEVAELRAEIEALGRPTTEWGIQRPGEEPQEHCGFSETRLLANAEESDGYVVERTAYRGKWHRADINSRLAREEGSL